MNEKQYKITLCGYYGIGNLGDEIILESLLQKLSENPPRPPFTHQKNNPIEPDSAHPRPEIHVLKSKNPIKILAALAQSDIFAFGGGSLLQNSTSTRSLLWYCTLIRTARRLCPRCVMVANGIGPIVDSALSRDFLLNYLAKTVNLFDEISVRDRNSQLLLSHLLPNRKIHLLPDPAIDLLLKKSQKINQRLINPQKITFILHVGALKKHKITPETLATTLNSLKNQLSLPLSIIVLNENEDGDFARATASLTCSEIYFPKTSDALIHALSNSKIAITQRYHGAIASICMEIPTLSISADPKLSALSADFVLFPAIFPTILTPKATVSCENNTNNLVTLVAQILKHHEQHKSETLSRLISVAQISDHLLKKIVFPNTKHRKRI